MPAPEKVANHTPENGQEVVKQRVRLFYDQVGWQIEADGVYQNARYEDLRPVSREYVHRCHLRVNRHLRPKGKYFLDAGSGPVQYIEYLTYSQGYSYRVCVDLSLVALLEARKRLENHALCVVADVSCLPFSSDVFDSAVSLHTFHHLPLSEQPRAYQELVRVLAPDAGAVVVNGWTESSLMRRFHWLVRLSEYIGQRFLRLRDKRGHYPERSKTNQAGSNPQKPAGTYIQKLDAAWLNANLGGKIPYRLYPWRSVSVRFLRAIVHRATGGVLFLRILYHLEERFPDYFAVHGQYPMIVIQKNPTLKGKFHELDG